MGGPTDTYASTMAEKRGDNYVLTLMFRSIVKQNEALQDVTLEDMRVVTSDPSIPKVAENGYNTFVVECPDEKHEYVIIDAMSYSQSEDQVTGEALKAASYKYKGGPEAKDWRFYGVGLVDENGRISASSSLPELGDLFLKRASGEISSQGVSAPPAADDKGWNAIQTFARNFCFAGS